MILDSIIFIFQNRKMFFSKKADMAMETIIFLALLFLAAIVIFFLITKNNVNSLNVVDDLGMLQGASYD